PPAAPAAGPGMPALVAMFAMFAALAGGATDSMAMAPPPPGASSSKTVAAADPAASGPDSAVLEQLRSKLTAPADCLPHCADIARLRVEARGSRVQLRLDVHALADATLPLSGQGANWRPSSVTGVDGKPIAVRRDADGALWMAARAGVTQVLLSADVGDATNVEISLPLPPRELVVEAEGWAVSGLDARGQASSALTLSRSATGSASGAGATQRDALPPFVRVERTLHLGLLWTVETQITRLTPSRAPVRVRVKLIEGESVNDEVVRVEDGYALLQLGAEDSASFVGTLKESAQLHLFATKEANQIEVWRLDPSAQWHLGWSGIAPVRYVDSPGGDLMPTWQPWPGEGVGIDVSKPAGAAGQTLTIDRLRLAVAPGLRATEVTATATLRSSQGSNHRVQLPEGAEFLGLSLDGQAQSTQPQGRELLIPITPGEHALKIDWREPRGLGWVFRTAPYSLGASGVNASTEIRLPPERVVLAVGGPRVGPAVLFWGVVVALLLAAIALGRSRVTPLGAGAWFLLGLGLAQSSLIGAAVVVAWFFVFAARRRIGLVGVAGVAGDRWPMRLAANMLQVVLLVWTLIAAAFLFDAVRAGLLGYPDLMIAGNGSSARLLTWYQDRFADQAMATWVLSAPVIVYRLLMLGWALWLAASVLRWIRWAWDSFGAEGYWRRKPAKVEAGAEGVPPAAVGDPRPA
ncbi:MAG: hypothetical protein M3Z29_14460, partial [Pseudomonadota bacterium]|nr:hypothetical protein [Pseudomonadota bacterium]